MKPSPASWKMKGKRKKKDMQGREENIFKCGLTMLKPFPAPWKMRGGEEKGEMGRKR